jgi:hypothetical protein
LESRLVRDVQVTHKTFIHLRHHENGQRLAGYVENPEAITKLQQLHIQSSD